MSELWPELPLGAWQDTLATLQRWMQIVGKIRLTLAPRWNHWWHVTFYLTARGLTTSPMPYRGSNFQIDFDFIDHELIIETNEGAKGSLKLFPRSVAAFYRELMDRLHSMGIDVPIWTVPEEIEDRTPFERDEIHATYDAEYAHRLWKILANTDRIFKEFRGRFIGKVSPVHFFWGGFDLAVTRFSGRRAPKHPGAPFMARYIAVEAYSHEVSSCGFWPGAVIGDPVFYSYAYPEPEGYKDCRVQPAGAYYHDEFHEFFLPYSAIRGSDKPDEDLLAFCQSTYEAAANQAKWDRASLES